MPFVPKMPKPPSGGSSLSKRLEQMKKELDAKHGDGTAVAEEAVGGSAGPQLGQEYTLQEGDTLQSIGAQVEQDPDAIWTHEKNDQLREGRGSPNELEPGDTLFIPENEKGKGPVGKGDYVVKQGDCMASIAVETGHFWEKIWNDPKNEELKRIREDPNVLLPGDRVTIPELKTKEESGATEERHRFVRRGCPEKLIIQFKVEGKPRANESYVLEIDEIRFRGTTDSDGVVAVFIPPDAEKGKIVFPDSGEEYPLELGDLDPITEITGVQGRLRNLGFYDGPVDGEVRDELARAISVFQERHNLEASGDLDESIRDAIQNAYGS